MLSDDDFELLQQQSVSARETAQTPGWEIILDRVRAGIAKRQDAMISGSCRTWEEYRKYSDWLECALWVLRIPDEIEQDVEDHRELRKDYE